MFGFRNLKIRTKLLIAALAIAFIPASLIGIFAWHDSREALQSQAFNQLQSVREIKKAQLESFFAERKADLLMLAEMVANIKQNTTQKFQTLQYHQKTQIESYFTERLSNISVFSKNETIIQFLAQFESAFHDTFHEKGHEHDNNNKMEGDVWQTLKDKFGSMLTQYLDEYGYDDLLVIAPDGDIIYSVAEQSDLGQNLLSGALKFINSPLKKAFQKGLHGISIQDFAPYAPADDQYVAFLTAPVFHSDKLIGVLAFSLSPDNINAIVQRRDGMGQTGESYLVGQSNGQTSYRSNRVTKGKEASIGDAKSGEDIDKALAGQSGVAIKTGSTGVLELGAYAPLKIQDLNWSIITTMALEELLSPMLPKGARGQGDFFANYIRQYGYYDLFLFDPQGEIFYTVAHKADYGTNILSGKYANSGLGELVENVLQTRGYGISDFALYAPSNNEPTAFIAKPLFDHNGSVDLVIALQLSDKAISQIMHERTGMGKTGETCLVGNDKLMRSISYHDRENHSIIASFANPTQNAVMTDASRTALEKGKTGI